MTTAVISKASSGLVLALIAFGFLLIAITAPRGNR
jgi:hypothetical protein